MKTRKTVTIALVIVLSLIIGMLPARAGDYITVTLDGNVLEFDVQPQIIRDRTMVPMRKIFESLGAVVTWDAPTRTATGKKGDVLMILEAMKMENDIVCPVDGTIASVNVQKGASVETGAVLCVIA